MINRQWMAVCMGAGMLAAQTGCGVPGADSVLPIVIPSCEGGTVVYDTGGTNGYGRQSAVSSGQVTAPTDMAFVPGMGGAFVVIEQAGYAVYFNGSCAAVNRIDLRAAVGGIGVVSGGEQGLLNIEFHPNYVNNRFIFFYHTSVANTVNTITRMTAAFGASGALLLSDPRRIIDFRKDVGAAASNHNGGGLVFAPDNTLLASIGDGGADSSSAQADTRLLGKVIRILPSLTAGVGGYSIPGNNMFAASNAACSNVAVSAQPCPEILAKGLRNPFRMARDGNVIYLGDVGAGTEEINSFIYTINNVNFGWPTHDGYVAGSPLTGYRNPIVYYTRNGATAAAFRSEDPMGFASTLATVIIGDVYHGTRYSAALNSGALLFGEFYDGYIRAVGVNINGEITDTDAAPGFHLVHAEAISSMVQGPDGYLYFTALFGPATVYRLVWP